MACFHYKERQNLATNNNIWPLAQLHINPKLPHSLVVNIVCHTSDSIPERKIVPDLSKNKCTGSISVQGTKKLTALWTRGYTLDSGVHACADEF